LSTAESELIALTAAAQEAIWLQILLAEVGFPQIPTTIFEDNQACIALAKNPQNHKRLQQLADPFTKILPGHRLRPILYSMGLSKLHSQGSVRIDC